MLSVREALTRAADQLAAHPLLRETALADAALLLMYQLGAARAALIAHPERVMDRDELAAYQSLISRRLTFEPLQYIVGVQEFYGLALKVTRAVLIPRPETELLVEAVLARAPARARVVDVGTGSGAIAIALAANLPGAEVTAVDVSADALAVARENAVAHAVSVRFLKSDLLRSVAGETFDVVVANPPYVCVGEELHPQVRDYEPATALFAGEDGLAVYRRLVPEAFAALAAGGVLAMEIGFGQGEALRAMLIGWDKVEVLRDLQGIERVVVARRK